MKHFALFFMLLVPMTMSAQKQYFLPTGDSSMDEKERPLIEVYLPKQELANGCAVVLCPGGAMRWLSWESDVVKMATFLNERGIAAIGLRYHLNKGGGQMPQGAKMPPMVDVTHPDQFPQADANPMHFAYGDSIIRLAAADAQAAIRMVREHADEWHISKDKIGFLGFSAGGGVAIAATMSADEIERPDFLCTNFGPSLMPVTVPKNAPPLLIMTRVDHPNVAAGLVALFMEWKKAGANAELHMYGDGKGPYELMPETGETTTETWSTQLIQWLKAKGLIKELTFANMAGIYDDEKQESRFCLNEDGTATWGMIGSLHFTEYTYTINGNTICLKPKDVESEDDCYEYDENTRTLKNEQGTVYYRQVVE